MRCGLRDATRSYDDHGRTPRSMIKTCNHKGDEENEKSKEMNSSLCTAMLLVPLLLHRITCAWCLQRIRSKRENEMQTVERENRIARFVVIRFF